jgi:3-methyl-2-oxobutanoate hydroxymethyltransferase
LSSTIQSSRLSTLDIRSFKSKDEPIVALTAYDFPQARWCDAAGVDILLVGDSMNSVVYGERDTLSITVEDMIRPVRSVVRGSSRAMVVADLPFLSYEISAEDALRSAGRFVKDAGAGAVKLEGGAERASTVLKLSQAGIPVMGHIGLTPQRILSMGKYRMHGKEVSEKDQLIADAQALCDAGAFAIVLECVDSALSIEITKLLPIPTIGIGSGKGTDGQILVLHDLLGFTEGKVPRFVTPEASLGALATEAIGRYCKRTKERTP